MQTASVIRKRARAERDDHLMLPLATNESPADADEVVRMNHLRKRQRRSSDNTAFSQPLRMEDSGAVGRERAREGCNAGANHIVSS